MKERMKEKGHHQEQNKKKNKENDREKENKKHRPLTFFFFVSFVSSFFSAFSFFTGADSVLSPRISWTSLILKNKTKSYKIKLGLFLLFVLLRLTVELLWNSPEKRSSWSFLSSITRFSLLLSGFRWFPDVFQNGCSKLFFTIQQE